MYVIGVGVAGGMVLRARSAEGPAEPASRSAMIAGMHVEDELSAA